MPDSYDVIVVGAGPAGSATARDAAHAGQRVLLVEDHRVVGKPMQCSGFVSPRTLDLAGVAPSDVVIDSVRGAWVHGRAGARLRLGGDRTYAYAMDRTRFDQLLAAQAEEAGAELRLGTRLLGFERRNGAVSVRLASGGREYCSTAPLLVGADGAHSTVARTLGRPRPSQVVRALGAELGVPPRDPGMVDIFVGRDLTPGWFGWSIPLGDGRVRVGVGTTERVSPAVLLARLRGAFPRHFASDPEPGSFAAGLIPLWEPGPAVSDHVMLVGDAANQVKPSTGGGIHSGLVGARHAARRLGEALAAGRFDRAFLEGYTRRWSHDLAGEFRDLRRLRTLFLALGDHQTDVLLRLLARPPLQRIIAQQGDIDFPARMFLSLGAAAPDLLPHLPRAWIQRVWGRLGQGRRGDGAEDAIPATPVYAQ